MIALRPSWVVCQLGAREHYAVAQALAARGRLTTLVTEAWSPLDSPWRRVSARLAQRFHPALDGLAIRSFTGSSVLFEAQARIRGLRGWDLIQSRNRWFQRHALTELKKLSEGTVKVDTQRRQVRAIESGDHVLESLYERSYPTLFCYSYVALELFRWAKAQGWRTVLGQIDAGPAMDTIVSGLGRRYPAWQRFQDAPPKEYWHAWREECRVADEVVVNSRWVADALVAEGLSPDKVSIIPLAYVPSPTTSRAIRDFPDGFSSERPLRVVFVGQVSLLKGIVEVLEAARGLIGEFFELTIVGPVLVNVPEVLRALPTVRWIGSVPRSETAQYYESSDVLLFPSHGDGFGLVQLEAQAWGLPVIASRHCGDVVTDGVNGVCLPEVSASAIERAIRHVLEKPRLLREWAAASQVHERFSLASVGTQLIGLERENMTSRAE